MTFTRMAFLAITSTFILSRSFALPLYCKKVDEEIMSEANYCLQRNNESSARDLSLFAEKFNQYHIDNYKNELEKKIATSALASLNELYREKLSKFPSEKTVNLSYDVKQCLAQRGIALPPVRANGKLSAEEGQKRIEAVKNIMGASFLAEAYFKEIENLKREESSLTLADPKTIRSDVEIKKFQETFAQKQELKNKVKELNQELIVLSGLYPQLFDRDKNIFLYPTGEMKRSQFQKKLSQHFQDKIGLASVSYQQSMISHDRSRVDLEGKTFDHITSFINRNSDALFNEKDLMDLSFTFEQKEAQSLNELNKSMKELCEGNIEQLHNNPLLMTSIYEKEIKNGDEILFQMAHCQMIDENPEDPGANWGLLLAAGGLVAVSFIPGGAFAAMAVAGGVGFGIYGAGETYNSYHNLQLERGLAHAQIVNQEQVIDREKELALNSYFSLLDAVSPGFGKLGAVKSTSNVNTQEVGQFMRASNITPIRIEADAEDIFFGRNPFELYWAKNNLGSEIPITEEGIIKVIGREKFKELNQKFLDLHHNAVDEFEMLLRENDIPFTKKLRDGRITITINNEVLNQMEIPASRLISKLTDYRSLDDKLRKYMLLQKYDQVDDNLIPNQVFEEVPKMDLVYDPYTLGMNQAVGLNLPHEALYLRMNDVGNLLTKGRITGTTRHEMQHRYFEVQRSQNKFDSPYHSEFVVTNNEARLGKTSYGEFQSSEELYNFTNQAFWDMKPGYININNMDVEQFQKALNDFDDRIPSLNREALGIARKTKEAILIAEQTKNNALKVIEAARKEASDPDVYLNMKFGKSMVGIDYENGLQFNRYMPLDDLLKYQRLIDDYAANNSAENLKLVLDQKKKILSVVEQSAADLIEKSQRVIAFQENYVGAMSDFQELTARSYQKLREGTDLTLEEAKEIKTKHEELYRLMRKFALTAQ